MKKFIERLGWRLDDIRDRIASGWDRFKWALMCAVLPSLYTNLFARYRSLIEICDARDEEYQADHDRWVEEIRKLEQEIAELRNTPTAKKSELRKSSQ